MKRFLQVFFALVLAYGWLWTSYLEKKEVIPSTWIPWVLAGLGVLFLMQQLWISAPPKPKSRSSIEEQREIAQTCLDTILAKYNVLIADEFQTEVPLIRVNLMLATRAFPLFWRMKIYYCACAQGLGYGPDEMSAQWTRGEGAVGYAWNSRESVIFDSEDERFKVPLNSISKDKIKFAGRVKSALVVPNVRGKSVAGMLILDSECNIDRTHFQDDKVVRFVLAYAKTATPVCFSDGVLGKPLLSFR